MHRWSRFTVVPMYRQNGASSRVRRKKTDVSAVGAPEHSSHVRSGEMRTDTSARPRLEPQIGAK
jgi:hypothetical protein